MLSQRLLTVRQRQLLDLIEQRNRNGRACVQQDLAEDLGIRRDSLNKLLSRTRRILLRYGKQITMPPRSHERRALVGSLTALPST